MKVDWVREFSTLAQYLLFSIVAATVGLIFQAESYARSSPVPEGMTADFFRSDAIRNAPIFYNWLIIIMLGLGAARLIILFLTSRESEGWKRRMGGTPDA